MWQWYAIGYLFSVLVGHFFVAMVADQMWQSIGWKPAKSARFRPDAWQPRVLGVIERFLYTSSLLVGKAEFIGFWLAVKVAGQWKRWSEDQESDGVHVSGRSIYQNFLIGNGLSILFSIVGYKLIEWLPQRKYTEALCVPVSLMALTMIIYFWIRRSDAEKPELSGR